MDRETIRRKQKELLFPQVSTYYEEPLAIDSGKGMFVKDVEGKEYLDFFGGILTVSVGHCHPKVTDAVIEQQKKLVHVSTLLPPAMRSIVIPVMVIDLFVAGMPNKLPVLVARVVQRVTTLSPSATISSIVMRKSGKAVK